MHVICKKCGGKIAVAGRPRGTTTINNIQVKGNVSVGGGTIGFGPGGSISFGPGGSIGLGGPQKSGFSCMECGTDAEYEPNEIKDD
jgi:hypothetical protein